MRLKEGVLISTLGTEPQVVTLSLHALLAKGELIRKAIALHSQAGDAAIAAAVATLRERWADLPFASTVELELYPVPISDLDSELSLKVSYRALSQLIRRHKAAGLRIHLNVSGGRKPLGLCALIAAQFLFTTGDKFWYLVSSPELVRSRRLLPRPGDRWRLIELPVPLWSDEGALLAALAEYEDPWALAQLQRRLAQREEAFRWRHFLSQVLTKSEREVVEELVMRGGTDAEIAGRLGKSPRTVGHQLSSTFRKLRGFLGWPKEVRIDRTVLVSLLLPHLREISLSQIGKVSEDMVLSRDYSCHLRR